MHLLLTRCAACQRHNTACGCWLAPCNAWWHIIHYSPSCASHLLAPCVQATAFVSLAAGGLADRLQAAHRWSAVRVRRAMQLTATLGTGLRWGKVVGKSGRVCKESDGCRSGALQSDMSGQQRTLGDNKACAPAYPGHPRSAPAAACCRWLCLEHRWPRQQQWLHWWPRLPSRALHTQVGPRHHSRL